MVEFCDPEDLDRDQLAEKQRKGYQALDVMEGRLAKSDFLVDAGYSIADIALYVYTQVAGEAGMTLDDYPGIRRWLDRVAEQPGYILITQEDFD
ncbi:MAG: glutathione binding-like protein [Alphaproteobacteria bacterium]